MDDWVYWMIVAVVLAAAELAVFTGFIFGPLAAAAVVSAIVAAVGASTEIQLGVFLILGIVSILALRPVAKRHLSTQPELRSNVDALIGKEGRVLERLSGDKLGLIRFDNDNWTARPAPGITEIAPETKVRVVHIAGATAIVEPTEETTSATSEGADA